MVMMRATTPSTYILAPRLKTPPLRTPPLLPIPLPTSSPPFLLPSTNRRAYVLKVTFLPQKRLCIAPGPRYEVGKCSSAPTARPNRGFRADYGFVGTQDAEIRRDPDREIDASDMVRSKVRALRTMVLAQQTKIGDLQAVDRRRQAQLAKALSLPRTLQTQIAALQSQQRPARDPAHPGVSEEAGSSS
ncbi:hypothetical protein Tco_0375678 [Tanacetum coccineum]